MKAKCTTCGKRFTLLKSERYTVTPERSFVNILQSVERYDAFDCPHCGCQNEKGIRRPKEEEDV